MSLTLNFNDWGCSWLDKCLKPKVRYHGCLPLESLVGFLMYRLHAWVCQHHSYIGVVISQMCIYFTYLTLFMGFGGNDSYASHLAAPFSSTTSSFLSLLLLLKSRWISGRKKDRYSREVHRYITIHYHRSSLITIFNPYSHTHIPQQAE